MEDERHKQQKLTSATGKVEFKTFNSLIQNTENLSLKTSQHLLNRGQKIAIVGPTGAGKTTLVNLLMRFNEINGGDILIDDVSIHDLTRENIHDLFCMVLQDTWLFEGSIKGKFNL